MKGGNNENNNRTESETQTCWLRLLSWNLGEFSIHHNGRNRQQNVIILNIIMIPFSDALVCSSWVRMTQEFVRWKLFSCFEVQTLLFVSYLAVHLYLCRKLLSVSLLQCVPIVLASEIRKGDCEPVNHNWTTYYRNDAYKSVMKYAFIWDKLEITNYLNDNRSLLPAVVGIRSSLKLWTNLTGNVVYVRIEMHRKPSNVRCVMWGKAHQLGNCVLVSTVHKSQSA